MTTAPLEVQRWIETELCDKLKDDEFVMESAALLKVGHDMQQTPLHCIRVMIADAVLRAAGMPTEDVN